jgi:cellulose biosynthesis protein BcsQ
MRCICVASGKGGTSKTSLVAALGVWLAKEDAGKVAIADLNFDQATLTNWWTQRGRPLFPHLLKITDFATDVAALRKTKWRACLIDTPPCDLDVIESAIMESDACLIPVRASELDIAACKAVVDLCHRRRKPFAFILVQVDTRPAFRKINDAAVATLREIGRVLPVMFTMNKAYVASIADKKLQGKTGFEIDKSLEEEIAAICDLVEHIGETRDGTEGLEDLLGIPVKPKRKK